MYYAGSYRESVTRYNHKNIDRWLHPARAPMSINWIEVESCAIIALSVATLIVLSVMILQAA